MVALPFREKKAERAEVELHALLRLANQLQSNLDLDAVVEVIATAASETFGFAEASVYVREAETGALRARAAIGPNRAGLERILSTPCPLVGLERLLMADYAIGAAFLIPSSAPGWTPDLRACLCPSAAQAADAQGGREDDTLLLPLYDKRRHLTGLLNLSAPVGGARPALDTIASLSAFATHASVAIENAREHEQLQRVSSELEEQLELRHELLDASRTLLSTLDEIAVFSHIADMLDALVTYDAMGIGLIDKEAGLIRTAYFAQEGVPLDPDVALDVNDPVLGPVIESGRAVLVDDGDSGGLGMCVPGTECVPQSAILAPLSVGGEVFGLLSVGRYDAASLAQPYGSREFELVQLFANLAGIALNNARSYKEMTHLATSDGLTGVHNYRHFRETLSVEVSRAERYGENFCLLMMDLDHFKAVNDTAGHQQGDEVLKAVGSVLRQCSRESDYAARYGGEEFVMILPRATLGEARTVAERIRSRVREIDAGSPLLTVSMSIGVAAYPDDVSDADEVLRAADTALLQAKAAGRNRVCLYSPRAGEAPADGELVGLGRMFARHIGMTDDETSGLVAALAVLELAELGAVGRGSPSSRPFAASDKAVGGEAISALIYSTERWDGGGYPEGLRGRNIPRVARVLAVMRGFMAEGRGPSSGQTNRGLRRRAGTELDPHLVQRFLRFLGERPHMKVEEPAGS